MSSVNKVAKWPEGLLINKGVLVAVRKQGSKDSINPPLAGERGI